jgi:hypothetical protein
MAEQMTSGRYVMVLVQCRNTRKWNDATKQFDFMPKEDYVIAAYSVSAQVGTHYTPSYVVSRWVSKVIAGSEGRTQKLDADCIQIFESSPQGCNLTKKGVMFILEKKRKEGVPDVKAFTLGNFADPTKYGWRGGSFPKAYIGALPARRVMIGTRRGGLA